ncbi:hypothetical protein BRD16_09195 [Halobacteriales archaeon SW_6_65_46]|nr:MAG: hypothetical protein BRD16_09195 [Halobacteriales archaeon SW_6_65_46]
MGRLSDHYDQLRNEDGCGEVTFGVGDRSASWLARKFAAVDGSAGGLTDDRTLVTTGIGMTGPPHLGTLGQILTIAQLQTVGVDIQFVLADLEPYHGGHSLNEVRRLAGRFRAFARDCGIDPDAGRLRTQEEARDVMHTAQLLAPYYDESHWPETEPTPWETAVEQAYERASTEPPNQSSPAATTHSAVLHLADFLHPLRGEYDRVVLALGADERGLLTATRSFLSKTPVMGEVAGLHGRMISGLADAPKMGRSLPGSVIHLGMDEPRIRARLTGPETDAAEPAESLVFQAMCLASAYDGDRLTQLERACRENTDGWERARAEYAEYVCDRARAWQATASPSDE